MHVWHLGDGMLFFFLKAIHGILKRFQLIEKCHVGCSNSEHIYVKFAYHLWYLSLVKHVSFGERERERV